MQSINSLTFENTNDKGNPSFLWQHYVCKIRLVAMAESVPNSSDLSQQLKIRFNFLFPVLWIHFYVEKLIEYLMNNTGRKNLLFFQQ